MEEIYKFKLNREKLEPLFDDFLEKINCDRYGYHFNDFGYENDVFAIRPYDYNGDCTCGFFDKEDEFYETHDHAPDCFTSVFRNEVKINDAEFDINKQKEIIKKICKQFNIPFPRNGWLLICTCGFDKLEDKFYDENYHAPDCELMQPNFWYKPSDLKIKWYKYPLRGAYANKKITVERFRKILKECIESYR